MIAFSWNRKWHAEGPQALIETHETKIGKFQKADGGTIFLDDAARAGGAAL